MNNLTKLTKAIEAHPTATLVSLLTLVFVVRAVVAGWILFPEDPARALFGGGQGWGQIAMNLLEGHGYAEDPPEPTARRGPVPVLFLSGLFLLFGKNLWPVMVANWLFDVATAYVLFRIVLEIFPSRLNVAYLAITLWAFYVPEISDTNRAISEPLFTLLLSGHVWTVLRLGQTPSIKMAAVSGLLLAGAMLCRPIVQPWLLVVWLLLLFSPGMKKPLFKFERIRGIIPALVTLTIVFSLAILPWAMRNYLVFDAFIPGATGLGGTLLINNGYLDREGVVRIMDRREMRDLVRKELAASGEKHPTAWDAKATELALEKIRAHPGRYLELCGYRFLRLLFNLGYGKEPSLRSYFVATLNAVLLCLAVASFFWFKGDWLSRSVPVVILIAYFVTVHVLLNAVVRYIFPVMPYVIVFAAYTLVHVPERLGFSKTYRSGS